MMTGMAQGSQSGSVGAHGALRRNVLHDVRVVQLLQQRDLTLERLDHPPHLQQTSKPCR